MKLRNVISLFGICSFLFSTVSSCEFDEYAGTNDFFSEKLLSEYGIPKLMAPNCEHDAGKANFYVDNYYCEFFGEKNYFWEYANEIFDYLKRETNLENIYFTIDEFNYSEGEDSGRVVTYYYLYKSDDILDYVDRNFFYDTIRNLQSISFYYTLYHDAKYLYKITIQQMGLYDYTNNPRNKAVLELSKNEFYSPLNGNENNHWYLFYTILNEKDVTQVRITNDNFLDYFNIDIEENIVNSNPDNQAKGIDIRIQTKSRTYTNVAFKIEYFDGETNVLTKILQLNDYIESFQFYFDKDSNVDKNSVKISLYREGDVFLYYKSTNTLYE